MPATARESIQCSVCSRDAARIASAIPGASRSITSRVASGVTSLGREAGAAGGQHELAAALVGPVAQPARDQLALVGDHLGADDLGAEPLGERGERRAALVLALARRASRSRP